MQSANALRTKEILFRHDIQSLKGIISTATRIVPDEDYHNLYKRRMLRALGLTGEIISFLRIAKHEIKLPDLRLKPGSEDPPLRKDYVFQESHAEFIGIVPHILGNYAKLKSHLSGEDIMSIRHAIGAFVNIGLITDDHLAMSRQHTQQTVDLAVEMFEEHSSESTARHDTVVVNMAFARFWKPELAEIFYRNPEFRAVGSKLYFEIDFNEALDSSLEERYGVRLESMIKSLGLWELEESTSGHKTETE
ncbi:MAG: hypothetical protein KGH98_03845 [Candidatus Micrarchaeota archaeon]|nr:hypothetical protein [Candidatus Micrarchaeota archaeon]